MKSIFIALLVVLLSVTSAESSNDELISVTGNCKKNILPDRVSISVTIEELNKSQRVSSENANLKYNAFLKKIKSMKLKDADYATTEYRVFQHKVWENRKQVMKGYKTKITLKISTSETKKTGKLLSLGSDFGQDFVTGPNPHVSDNLFKKTYLQCISLAMADAEEKAQRIVKNSGRKLGELYSVYEGQRNSTTNVPRPIFKSMRMEAVSDGGGAAPANIEFGKNKINVVLSIAYRLK